MATKPLPDHSLQAKCDSPDRKHNDRSANILALDSRSRIVPQAKYQHLVKKYNELHDNYRRLETSYELRKEDFEKLKENFEKSQQELASSRDIVRQWQTWIDANQKVKSKAVSRAQHARQPTVNLGVALEEQRNYERICSSQTTESDENDQVEAQAEPSSDDIEIVSSRPVKCRRRVAMAPPSPKIKQEANSPENPIELGSEGYSSPLQPQKPIPRTETSDLDALTSVVRTPRKRRAIRAAPVEVEVPQLVSIKSSLSGGDDLGSQIMTSRVVEHPHTRNVLAQLSTNVLSSQGNAASRTGSSRKRSHDDMRRGVASLSEDGDMDSSQAATPTLKYTGQGNRDQRLETLLVGPTPGREPLTNLRTPETVVRLIAHDPNDHQDEALDNSMIQRPVKEPTAARSRPSNNPLQTKHSPRPPKYSRLRSPPPPDPDPNDEPLRSRQLNTLSLSDFRINPTYQSTDYAFADTLRGRDQRRCLPGCTKPTCCGVFLRAAQTGAIPTSKPDHELLEDYLGPAWREVLSSMGEAKREEMRVQARAFALASEHGRHRQAFSRAASPPGYWRTGMPSTQEAAEDREKAVQFEREKVEERWREALRENGRWIFRDE